MLNKLYTKTNIGKALSIQNGEWRFVEPIKYNIFDYLIKVNKNYMIFTLTELDGKIELLEQFIDILNEGKPYNIQYNQQNKCGENVYSLNFTDFKFYQIINFLNLNYGESSAAPKELRVSFNFGSCNYKDKYNDMNINRNFLFFE